MAKKGKYQLLSYLVDKELIYYKSLNRTRKIVAFALFETISFNSIMDDLNECLIKRYIHYYSLQLKISEKKRKVVLLNFEETKKENIIKLFNIFQQKIKENNSTITFLKNTQLEKAFLEPILKEMNSKVSLWKQSESIEICNDVNTFILNLYSINFNYLENKEHFIDNFLKISNSFNRKGYLTLNFIIDSNDEIKFSPYFSEFVLKNDELFNTEKNINTFFNYNLLNRQMIKQKELFNYLWRLGISNVYFPLKEFNQLFMTGNQHGISILLKFNKNLEQNLLKNRLDFVRLSKNLLLIEQTSLFLVLIKLESKYLQRIIEKYKSKYFIYIMILNKKEYQKLIDITPLNSIKNIKILNPDEILDLNIFKNK